MTATPTRPHRTGQLPPEARGLGWQHRQQAARLMRELVDGTPCWWCAHPMRREQRLSADHTRPRVRGGTIADRLLHRECNAQRGDGSRDDQRPAVTGAPCPCPMGRAIAAGPRETPRRAVGSRVW